MEVALQSLLASTSGRLKTLIVHWARIEARVWLPTQLWLFLEVRKLLNRVSDMIEGRFRSRSYGKTMLYDTVIYTLLATQIAGYAEHTAHLGCSASYLVLWVGSLLTGQSRYSDS